MIPRISLLLKALALCLVAQTAMAVEADPIQVLFVNGTDDDPVSSNALRQEMSDWLNTVENGTLFRSVFVRYRRPGALAEALAQNPGMDVVILDLSNTVSYVGRGDGPALQAFYASGKRALMLDGSFGIRNLRIRGTSEVRFPGVENSSAALLANQVTAIARAGGGILIGTDHNSWQTGANAALRAILPDARFRGTTNPSTDGEFIGDVLLNAYMPIKPVVLLRHWESVPNQGEAPVGGFTDFNGAPVQLFSLVEAADKPGGGRKRPYISASFDPGEARYAIDSDAAPVEAAPEPQLPDNMPTRKGPTR